MTIIELQSRSIETLADEYIRSRTSRSRPVSLVEAIPVIRALAPNTWHSDAELANLIASRAVRYGHAVEFDLPREEVVVRQMPAEIGGLARESDESVSHSISGTSPA